MTAPPGQTVSPADPVFTVTAPTGAPGPFVFASPHSGAALPEDMRADPALSAARINAADALACGLLSRVVLRDELAQAVEDLLHELDLGGPEAQAHLKRLFAQLPPGPVTAQVRELTAQNIAQARARGEAREGFAAFLDKRTASWRRRG